MPFVRLPFLVWCRTIYHLADCRVLVIGVRRAIVEGVSKTTRSEDEGGTNLQSSLFWKREYLGSVVSGGMTGTLASVLSRKCIVT